MAEDDTVLPRLVALREAMERELELIVTDLRHRISEMQDQIDRRFTALETQVDQRFAANQRELDQRSQWADETVRAALTAQQLQIDQRYRANQIAIDKAEAAAERRFDSVNEFRQSLADQTKTFVTEDKFEGLSHRLATLEGITLGSDKAVAGGRAGQVTMAMWMSVLIAVIALAATIIIATR